MGGNAVRRGDGDGSAALDGAAGRGDDAHMTPQAIVLNGGSSAGKTEIARLLQALLAEAWLTLGVDDLIRAAPNRLLGASDGLVIGVDGAIVPGAEFARLEYAWMAGIAVMVRRGARVIVDDVFLGGAAAQARWRDALRGLDILWVGVRCDPDVAALRELARGDRANGMARLQAEAVHAGVAYDLVVDTSDASALACARRIAGAMASGA
jgi:chloramphenicol 3-O phosphotransferase